MPESTDLEPANEAASESSDELDGKVFTKEWCIKMAKLEGDSEIGAGLLSFDPYFDDAV